MKTDIEIARSIALQPIDSIAQQVGLPLEQLEHYGRYLAKVDLKALEEAKSEGKLILVTAITPTKAGIGKTTVSIGLSLGMNRLGRRAVVALREPSLGPCFGQKGGAAGGGYAQVLPMEKINLHFTGDFHAITSAHNMITALLDNYIYQHRNDPEGLSEVLWKRVLDVNDRALRQVVTGLGGSANGIPAESGFDITPASEIMAILCLSTSLEDLRRRIDLPMDRSRLTYQLALLSVMAVCTSFDGGSWLNGAVWACLILLATSDMSVLGGGARAVAAAFAGRLGRH